MPKPVSEGHVWGKADDNKDKSDPPKLAKADGNKDKSNSSKLTTAEWWEKSHEKNLLPASKKRAVKKPKHLDASSSEKDDPAPHALAQTKPKPKAKRSRSTPPSSMANCKKSSNVIKPASKKSKSDTLKVDDSMPNQSPDNTSINKLTYPSSQKYQSTKPMPTLPGPDISVEVPITNETPVIHTRIIQKVNIRVNAIFEGGLVTSRSKSVFSGYQSTFPEFIGNMMEGSTTSGPVEVSLGETAVEQLWDEVSGIIYVVNSLMLHFLALFSVEEGNGLSPFAQNFSTAADLGVVLNGFFKAPTPDKRGQVAEGSGEDDDGALNDEDGGDDDGADENGNSTDDLLSPSIISQHVSEINHVEGVNNKDSDGEDDIDEDCLDRAVGNLPSSSDKTDFFYCGDSSAAYEQFRALVHLNDINDVSNEALKLIKLLVLRKLEKGAVTKAAKVKSISECWFNQKTKKPTTNKEENEDAAGDSLFIRRDSLVQLGCNIGGSDAIEYFHVLAFFSKYMNRWFVTKEDEFLWEVDVGKRQNVRVLVRLLQKRRSAYVEPKLEKNGSLASHHVFCINHFRDILRVERELVEM